MITMNLRRLMEAYRFKRLHDTSFHATIVAIQILLFALAIAGVLIFAFKEEGFESSSPQSAPTTPILDLPK